MGIAERTLVVGYWLFCAALGILTLAVDNTVYKVLALAAEEFGLRTPPRRVTRPDGAVLPFALALDRAVQPGRDQLVDAIRAVMTT